VLSVVHVLLLGAAKWPHWRTEWPVSGALLLRVLLVSSTLFGQTTLLQLLMN